MELDKEESFIQKRESVIQHVREENHMFYSSMQELIMYVSTHFLRECKIGKSELHSARNRIVKKGGNAKETISLVCNVINNKKLFSSIDRTLLNDLANRSKHNPVSPSYNRQYVEDIVKAYNDYVKSLRDYLGYGSRLLSDKCSIKFESLFNSNNKVTMSKQKSSQLVEDYKNGKIGILTLNAKYDSLSNDDKLELKDYFIEKFEGCSEKDSQKRIVRMGGNDWFVEIFDSSGYLYFKVGLLRKSSKFDKIKIYMSHKDTYEYKFDEYKEIAVGQCVKFEYKYPYVFFTSKNNFSGTIKACEIDGEEPNYGEYLKFRIEQSKVKDLYSTMYKN